MVKYPSAVETLIEAVVLGIVEGITEFLPISSTGHLLIAEHWLGRRSDLFNVAIQSGAILAVVIIYRERFRTPAMGPRQATQRDYLAKLLVAFAITVAGGLAAAAMGLRLPETVEPVAWALLLGGIAILGIERAVARAPPSERITWKVAVCVGLAQILAAVFPGTSRSLATIFAAMLAGCNSRPAATEFSFLLSIPTMAAATGYELLRVDDIAGENWLELGVGFAASAVTAFVAVKWLLSYIRTHTFMVFAWYRIAFGAGLLLLL
jgi:undecaprenyl-diphosphatase